MDTRLQSCTVCGDSFATPRTPGRPRTICSDACRVIAARTYRRDYIIRHFNEIAAA